MKTLKLIPTMAGGRDRRLLVKRNDDELDLILYKYGVNNGITEYYVILGEALKEWIQLTLKDSPQNRWQLDALSRMGPSLIYNYCQQIVTSLPLVRMGFKNPVTNNCFRYAVQEFLKKRGAL